ncbi:MAG: hypothetical protein WBK91_05500 [Alphaproteobacteria bacterium]
MTVVVHVQLLEEGTATARPTQAVPLENGLYKLLPTPDYDPEDEVWEFPPGAVVRCQWKKTADAENILLAYEQIG